MTQARLLATLRRLQPAPQRVPTWVAVLVGLLLCLLVALDLQASWAQQVRVASARAADLSQLLQEHARQGLRRVESVLAQAAQEVQRQARDHATAGAASGALRAVLPADGLLASLRVLDAQGRILAASDDGELQAGDLAPDAAALQAQRALAPGSLAVGRSVRNPASGLWQIPVRMRLDGALDATLLASLDSDYFQRLYRSIDTGEGGSVTLYSLQGWALARWPFSSEAVQGNGLDSPLFREHLLVTPQGVVRGVSAGAVQGGVLGYSLLPEYPLAVVVDLSLDEARAAWHQRALLELAVLALALALLVAASRLLGAQVRRSQQAESARRLSDMALQASSLPTLWIGPDARILRANQAACALHGYTEVQLRAMSVPDLSPRTTHEHWPALWQRLRQTRNMRVQSTHRTAQGEEIPVELEHNFLEHEGREYNFSFIRDLRMRVRTEAELQRSAAMLRGAIDAVDEAFVLFDADDRLVYCNAKYIDLYSELRDVIVPGARFEDLIRTGAQRGLYRDSHGREEEWVAERLAAHRTGNERRIQQRDDGRVLRVIDRRTPDGNIVGIRVDITEMVHATEEAQQASRAKSQFLANMSHEIRTPMNAILGLLALLQNTALSPVQRDYAGKTEGAAQSLLGLLNDILDFSKVEAGKLELDPQPLRLDRLLRGIAVILSTNMTGKSIELMFDIDPQVPSTVVADAMRLQQVLINLGGNAIKFTSQGQVVLRLCKRGERALPDGGTACLVEFAVQDSGIGIEPDKQEHIFSGFSQAEASTTRRFGGTGLGLAISRRLVELMGGRLALQSRPGEGSTFSFCLPLPLAPQAPEPAQEPQRSVAPKRTLIVDDNPQARVILAGITRSWSWPTQVAASGEEALALAAPQADGTCPFDLVYLDWQMPQMDGWELAQRLRALWGGCESCATLVMLSANGRDGLGQRTVQEQALVDAFLHKPVTASALLDAALGRNQDLPPPPAAQRSYRPLAGMRVLVVEDNLINQQVAEELLHAEGALVSLAANGQLGVDAVATSQPPFDVVLMDVQMPVLDGYGATQKIRQELGLLQLPIVAMTANAMASDRQTCLAAGMNEHVGKPFEMRHLVSVLLRVTGRDGLVAALRAPPPEGPDTDATQMAQTTEDPMFEHPELDLAGALERISGLSSLYVDIASEFLRSLDGVEAAYRSAAAAQGLGELVAQMHTLKGTAATLGAEPLSQHAARLEKLFRHPPEGLAPLPLLPALLEAVARAREAVQQAIAHLQGAQPARAAVPAHVPSPAERAAAQQLLGELLALLESSNLQAIDRFEQGQAVLAALSAQRLEALRRAMQSLDLAQACSECRAARAELAPAPGAAGIGVGH